MSSSSALIADNATRRCAPEVRANSTVATNLLRYLGPGATVVCAAEPVLLAYDRHRLFAVVVLTIRDGLVLKIEATADPSARQASQP